MLVFGRTGMGPGEFSYPRAAVASPDGDLYVVDKTGRIQCFRSDGRFSHQWRMPDTAAGKPTGLGGGPSDLSATAWVLYAPDTHYGRVLLFEPDGTHLGEFGSFGTGPGQFRLPTDVAIDRNGFIYVSEYGGNDRISRFSPRREYQFSFGGPDAGEAALMRPQSLLAAPDGTIWVADAGHHRICHFGPDGTFLGSFGRLGRAAGELKFPYNIERLSDGTLAVCEYGNNRIQRFDTAGRSLGTWGGAGRRPGELAYPWALAVGDGDRLFIIDSGNNRVQVIEGLGSRTWIRPSAGVADGGE